MIIYVEAHDFQPGKPPGRERLDDVHTIAEIWARLGLERSSGLVVMINGRLANWFSELRDGDVVQLLRAPGGG